MNKTLVFLLSLLFLSNSNLLFSSELAPLEITSLKKNSSYIIIAKVTDVVKVDENDFTGKNYIISSKIISYLKGKNEVKICTLSLWRGGLKGFNTIPTKNSFWIFFLNSLNKIEGKLLHPSSMLEFINPCIEK